MRLTHSVISLFFIIGSIESYLIRYKRQSSIATQDGIDIPFTLRSLITCITPGIRENICLGPRVQTLKSERIGISERRGATYGYHNGVDVRLLRPYSIPVIEDETEIGHSIGATVDVTRNDGLVEFGNRMKAFKGWRMNNGGIAEWDRQGAGVDVGTRADAADILKFKHTLFGVNVGPTSSRTLVGPHTVGNAKGGALRPSTYIPYFYPGYSNQGDWYKNQFKRIGDEYKSPSQRACPWCFAVDNTYPVEPSIFSG